MEHGDLGGLCRVKWLTKYQHFSLVVVKMWIIVVRSLAERVGEASWQDKGCRKVSHQDFQSPFLGLMRSLARPGVFAPSWSIVEPVPLITREIKIDCEEIDILPSYQHHFCISWVELCIPAAFFYTLKSPLLGRKYNNILEFVAGNALVNVERWFSFTHFSVAYKFLFIRI